MSRSLNNKNVYAYASRFLARRDRGLRRPTPLYSLLWLAIARHARKGCHGHLHTCQRDQALPNVFMQQPPTCLEDSGRLQSPLHHHPPSHHHLTSARLERRARSFNGKREREREGIESRFGGMFWRRLSALRPLACALRDEGNDWPQGGLGV
ncbi:hypothetical protein K505DRAFT_98651 [Melanomma pulvis-pyrius CBS 109.77]|uniref:Uncharacterized protein n=1 Tax=Melanomma pulvis-pyrius CBS 109.77 TaxID=1314802 RepID=A0A6A6WYU8_9PLEO|nr:hypothetical protein K505DRAFT_98651 [Melanomma pulvis-pyrius CBS 109.77]